MKNKFQFAMTLAVILAMVLTSLALADTITPDSDTVVVNDGDQSSRNLGNVAPGAVLTPTVNFKLVCDGTQHVDDSQSVSVAFTLAGSTVPSDGSLSATSTTIGATSGDVGVPATWPDDGNNNCTGITSINDNGDSTVTITAPTTAGLYTYKVKYNATPVPGETSGIAGSVFAEFTLTVVAPADVTAPVITKTITGTLGNDGWYTSDVLVDWTVSDPESSFTTSGCVDTTISSDTAGSLQSCSATSTGGTSSDSVTIKRDATAPAGVSGAPNRAVDNGTWYNYAVDVVFTGTDATSGIASCTTTNYSGPDGSSVTVNGSCTDNAGNVSTPPVASSAFNYDGSAPTGVLLSVTAGTTGSNGWYTSEITVHTSSDADISGMTCTLDQFQTTETAGTIFNGSCTNGAGLTTNAAPLTVKLDKTGPSASLAITAGTLGVNGWYTSDVTVDTSGSDSISSPVTCTVDQYQTIETTSTIFNGSCTNDAGLSANAAPLTVKLDKTGPSAALAVTAGAAGTNGWYTSDVTVSTLGSDDISGLASCSADQYQTTETAGQAFNGSCTNGAGLTTNAASLTVKLDKTAPSASLAVTVGTLGANGWYTSDVTISTTGSDSISSPVLCTSDQYQTDETTGQDITGSCTNDAGLSADAAPITVKLDKTGPTAELFASGTLGSNGWYISDVTISTFGTDDISSPVACTAGQSQTTDTTGATFDGSCTNDAGLTTAAASLAVKRDVTAPVITASLSPAQSGWYNIASSAPTVTYTCSDVTSLIASCTAPFTFLEGENQSHSGTAVDNAGNSASASVSDVDVDLTAPTLTWVGGPANGGNYDFGFVPAAPTCTAADLLSGPNGCNVSGYSDAVGSHTMTATAYDVAGNVYTENRSYNVEGWVLKGFYQPVDMNGVYNVVKNGSTVPLKFEVFTKLSGVEITDVNAVKSLTYAQTACNTTAITDEIETVATGGTVLRYDTTGGQFIFNWKTPSTAGKCYRVTMTTDDGGSLVAFFRLK